MARPRILLAIALADPPVGWRRRRPTSYPKKLAMPSSIVTCYGGGSARPAITGLVSA